MKIPVTVTATVRIPAGHTLHVEDVLGRGTAVTSIRQSVRGTTLTLSNVIVVPVDPHPDQIELPIPGDPLMQGTAPTPPG